MVRIALIALAFGWLALTSIAPGGTSAQSTPTLRVEPAAFEVNAGEPFIVQVVQDTTFNTTGVQASVLFDPSLLQVIDLQPGAGYAEATFLAGTGSVPDAITEANATGALQNVATFILPGSADPVPAGVTVAFEVTFTTPAGAIGSSSIELGGAIEVGDDNGGCYGCSELGSGNIILGPVAITAGTVTVVLSGAAPPPGGAGEPGDPGTPGTPAAAPAAASTPGGNAATPERTVAGAVSRPEIATASMSVEPASREVAVGEEFTFEIRQDVDVETTQAEVEVAYDQELIELVRVEPGDEWSDATGASDTTLDSAIEEGNDTGVFAGVSFVLSPGDDPIPAGETTVATLVFRGREGENGESAITLTKVQLQDGEGNAIEGEAQSGQVTVGSGGGGGGAPWLLMLGIVGVLVATAGGVVVIARRRKAWA